MTLNYSTPVINPRLGSSFAIFASAYTCLVVMLIVLEQLGLSVPTIDELIIVTPALFYIAIGFMTRTTSADDFLLAGQRVPPFYNALAFTSMVFGGSIMLGSIGSLFFLGIDAIAIPIGCFAGVVLTGVLFVPHLRKAGANTLPGFFHLRFGHRGVRLAAAALMLVPCLIIIVAEAALGGKLLGFFLPLPQALGINLSPPAFFLILVLASVVLTVALGGMRSATWTQCVQFVVVLGILAPLIAVSVIRTKLPLPQLTYGSQLEEIKAREQTKGFVTVTQPQPLSEVLPKPGAQPVIRPVERAFSAFRPMDFLLLVFCLATGVAAHPAFLPRLSMTPTIPASRRSMGWVTVVAGFLVLTIPAYAFFTKAMAVEALVGVPASDLPAWARALQQLGLINLPGQSIRFFQHRGATRDVLSGQPRPHPAGGRKSAEGFLRSRRGIGACRTLRMRRRSSRCGCQHGQRRRLSCFFEQDGFPRAAPHGGAPDDAPFRCGGLHHHAERGGRPAPVGYRRLLSQLRDFLFRPSLECLVAEIDVNGRFSRADFWLCCHRALFAYGWNAAFRDRCADRGGSWRSRQFRCRNSRQPFVQSPGAIRAGSD